MAEIKSEQVLLPRKVYVADTAELRCSFNSDSANLKSLSEKGAFEISFENFAGELDGNDYDIKQVQVVPSGIDFYKLVITFVPWKTGTIKFPPIRIEDVYIDFAPIQIVSITEQANKTTLSGFAAPLLLPGTTYKLYGLLIFSLLSFLLIIRLVIKRKSIAFFIKNRKLLRKYKKNKRKTARLLRSIKNKKIGSSEIAAQIQKIMRQYLEIRFDYQFTRAASSEFEEGFCKATGGLLPDEKNIAFGKILSSFVRTDFIRYSKNAVFNDGEVAKIVKELIKNIDIIETAADKNNKKAEESKNV